MSRWGKGDPWCATAATKNRPSIWTAALHYKRDNGDTWFNKVEVHAIGEEAVKVLQEELLYFLQTQEMCGVLHG